MKLAFPYTVESIHLMEKRKCTCERWRLLSKLQFFSVYPNEHEQL